MNLDELIQELVKMRADKGPLKVVALGFGPRAKAQLVVEVEYGAVYNLCYLRVEKG